MRMMLCSDLGCCFRHSRSMMDKTLLVSLFVTMNETETGAVQSVSPTSTVELGKGTSSTTSDLLGERGISAQITRVCREGVLCLKPFFFCFFFFLQMCSRVTSWWQGRMAQL